MPAEFTVVRLAEASVAVGLGVSNIIAFRCKTDLELLGDILLFDRVHADESQQPVLVRNQGIWQVDWTKLNAHVVDASCPPSQVHTALKSGVWEKL